MLAQGRADLPMRVTIVRFAWCIGSRRSGFSGSLGFGQAERRCAAYRSLFRPPFPQKIDMAELSAAPPARTNLVDFPLQIHPL